MSTQGAISNRLERIKRGDDPQVLAHLPSGYVILGKYQPEPIAGACMLIPDPVVPSINDLDGSARAAFMLDFVRMGDAILDATGAERINYLMLCNHVPELHAHAIPRFASEEPDLRLKGPFEAYDFGAAPIGDARGTHREVAERIKRSLTE